MFFSAHRLLVRIGRFVLAALLFAQFSYATQACLLPEADPSVALSTVSVLPHSGEGEASANLCLSHCLQAAQMLDALPAPLAKDIGFIPPLPVAMAHQLASTTLCEPELLSRTTSPPISIRYCVLRD
jgi:hypothetical protein